MHAQQKQGMHNIKHACTHIKVNAKELKFITFVGTPLLEISLLGES